MTLDDLNKRNSKGCREVKMSELEYRKKYSSYKTKLNSYDKETKTVIVYVPEDVEIKHEQEPKKNTVKYKHVKMPYSIYKQKYIKYPIKKDSYDYSDKSIIVCVPENVEINAESLKVPEKPKWYSITLSPVYHVRSSKASQMFMMPSDTKYWGYSIWIPNKLIEYFGDDYTISFSDRFEFTLFKESRDNTGKRVRSCETKLKAIDFRELINNSCCVSDTYTPPNLEPEHTEALKELMDIG